MSHRGQSSPDNIISYDNITFSSIRNPDEGLCLATVAGSAELCGLPTTLENTFCKEHSQRFYREEANIKDFLSSSLDRTKVLEIGLDIHIRIPLKRNTKAPRFGSPDFHGETLTVLNQSVQLIRLFRALETQWHNVNKKKIPFSDLELLEFGAGHPEGWLTALKLVANEMLIHGFVLSEPWEKAALYFHERSIRTGWVNLEWIENNFDNPKKKRGSEIE